MAIASDKTIRYLDMLEDKFNLIKFKEFIGDLLNLDQDDIQNSREYNAGSEQYKHYIDTVQLYAKYQDNKRRNIGILVIKLQSNKNPANARTLQRNYIAHLLDKFELDATLAAIYSETDDTWRLSFVKQEIDFGEGKFKTKFTPAKRYSYLFGKDEPNHTAKEQLLELLENNERKYSIEEIEEKFSVEKVTKDFFERYKENYLLLKETLESNEEFLSEAKRCDFTSEEFTKKLMGQIVFIYFLQKKGWLGVRLVPQNLTLEQYNTIYKDSDVIQRKILDKYYITFSENKKIKRDLLERFKENEQELEVLSDIFVDSKYDNEWGTGQKRFIRTIFENCKNRNKNFFDDYLEPFFYNGLNHQRKNQYFSVFNCKIPFLNGGLFEPLDNYQWEVARFNIDNQIFSNEEETGILDFFDRYNFTMNEEEPLEKDVAVDPEMLGKIFENLLDVKDRKSKGAFYTPREIVHYMCQESLANYLVNKVDVNYEEIKDFIQYGEMIRDEDLKGATQTVHLVGDSIFKNIVQIDKALENIKIADPAVGSGAFPLGILNEIVKMRDILTSYVLIYNRLGIFDRQYDEEYIIKSRSIYNIKWNTIKNCIYAVDIENSAVDITKLRLWLSIVVDQIEVPKSGPEPLPNLDCKIMQGNSLIDEYDGIKLIDPKFIDDLKDRDNVILNEGGTYKIKNKTISIGTNQIQFGDGQKKAQIDSLIDLKKELYGTNDPNRKKQLLQEIQNVRNELLRLNFVGTSKERELFEVDKSHNKPYFAWMLEYIEVFIENGGFDIVIGNPPYVSNKGIDAKEKENLLNIYDFSDDLYYHFIVLGLNLLKSTGINTMITPDTYFTTLTKENLRKIMLNNIIKQLIFLGHDVFSSAMVSTSISILEKNISNGDNYISVIDLLGEKNWNKKKEYHIKQKEYCNSINKSFFIPNDINIEINEKLSKIQNKLLDQYGKYISTSRDIEKNKDILNKYRENLKDGDYTLIGLVTEGGQGLATANNGKYIAVKEGTKQADRIRETREKKLNEFNSQYKTNYSLPNNEKDIWELFDKIKENYDRDCFGQGYIYKIINDEFIADVNNLTEEEKDKGIYGKASFVPYDKGDKDGNRWYLKTPYYIDWSIENVTFLKKNSGKKGKGMPVVRNPQFYFKTGLCYSDIKTFYLRCRKKDKTIHDVKSMSLFSATDKITDNYLILLINSKLIAQIIYYFVNNTPSFQINDCRSIPIVIPNEKQLKEINQIVNKAIEIQENYFNSIISKEKKDELLENIQKDVDELVLKIYKMEDLNGRY